MSASHLFASLLLLARASGHGSLTHPPSTRHGGTLAEAGRCESTACMWFTQPTSIPGEPTLPDDYRTFNLGVNSGAKDWTRKKPWRSPGTAPVFGSGCGISGGSQLPIPNGGKAWPGMPPQGSDGALLPRQVPALWPRGSAQEVAWGITANHGGGYSYRLCPLGAESEACFQRTVLRFEGDTQWLQYDSETYQYDTPVSLPRFAIPLAKVNLNGSEWARNPVPSCKLCDQSVCGPGLLPNLSQPFQPGYWMGNDTYYGGWDWFREEQCAQHCAGHNMTACPPGMTQFAPPLPGISGYSGTYAPYGRQGLPFSIVDRVRVPDDIAPGDWLLSWRWDCEQANQIWQSCADIRVV